MRIERNDHKRNYEYMRPCKDMSSYSDISNLLFFPEKWEKEIRICSESGQIYHKFDAVQDKLVVLLWVKMDIHNTGVNLLKLYGGENGSEKKEIIRVDTEGAFFYSYDKNRKSKLCHFESDKWYSIYLTVNIRNHRYSLYVDGERQLECAEFFCPVQTVHTVSMESYGGVSYVKQFRIYRPSVSSVQEAAKNGVILDAVEMGVPADGHTVVTAELQNLIDRCSESGGVVYLRDGIYLTGMIELKKNVTLYIEEGAVLKGVLDVDAYPVKKSKTHPNWNMLVQGPQKALIYADNQENIRIMGGGTIDGSGDFPGEYGSESLRVSAILLVGCPNVQLCDLYIKDAGMWTVPLVECDDLYIHDININSTWYPNRDGIDLCDCCNVLVENCNIKADDDAMCFKSGNESGCDNVLIRDCFIISTMANGIKFGTYSYGGFTNCTCERCIVKDTRTCAISIQCVDGGRIRNLQFHQIDIQNVESVFFILIGDKGRTPDWGRHRIGSIEEIVFDRIEAEGVRRSYGSYLGGFEKEGEIYPVRDILFSHVNVIYKGGVTEMPEVPAEFANQYPESNCFGILPGAGYFIRHAERVRFSACKTQVTLSDKRPVFYVTDGTEVFLDDEKLQNIKER